jgi:hypothetical protein
MERTFCCGHNAGSYTSLGSFLCASTKNVFIGKDTKGVDVADKQVVIGYNAIGQGTNTTVLGNNNITSLYCNVTSITNVSDERDKKNIINMDEYKILDTLTKIDPVKFIWNPRDQNANKGKKTIGFTAQNLQEAFEKSEFYEYIKNLVDSNDPEKLKINQNDLLPIIVQAIKELIIENNMLEKKLLDKYGIIV